MKKIINTLVILVASSLCLIFLSGCNKGDINTTDEIVSDTQAETTENQVSEELNEEDVDTYTLETSKVQSTFKIPKSLNYTLNGNASKSRIQLRNTLDQSSIIFSIFYSYPENSTKTAEDFPESDGYLDFNNITVGNYSGFEVYKTERIDESYQGTIFLTEPTEENSKVITISFNVIPYVFSEETGFNTRAFVTSDSFKNILQSFVANIDK